MVLILSLDFIRDHLPDKFIGRCRRIFGRLRGKTESMQKAKHKNGRHRSPNRHAYWTICLMYAVASFLVRGGEIRLSAEFAFRLRVIVLWRLLPQELAKRGVHD
jgi:hypothetical protein